MNVYFDNAATTPMRKEVIQSVSLIMNECFGNPSSTHAFGRTAKTHIETARKGIAKLLNAAPQEIIFTSGGTESDNMILNCATPNIEVDPETYEVRADGELLTCDPAVELPMAQRYFLF